MDSPSSCSAVLAPATDVHKKDTDEPFASVDPLLVKAIQNPRHRITVLRMELDIQRFIQNPELQQFEFPQFPTSFLKCCAHRVAQHYGLQTTSSEKLDKYNCFKSTVVAIKTSDVRAPPASLSRIPPVVSELERNGEEVGDKKIVILPRQGGDVGVKRGEMERIERSELERKEEYEKARARIFEGNGEEDQAVVGLQLEKSVAVTNGEIDNGSNNGGANRVAIFKDHFKDRTDPDFDRRRYFATAPQIGVQPHVFQYGAISPYMMMPPNPQFAYGYSHMDSNFTQFPCPNYFMFQGMSYPQYQQPLRY